VRPGARPSVIDGVLNDLRPDRIELVIAYGTIEIRVVHRIRRETALPEEAPPAFPLVDDPGVGLVGLTDGCGEA